MTVNPPPIQEKTTDPNNGRFPQVWIRWFASIKTCIDDIIERLDDLSAGTVDWGNIEGTLSDQTDLNNELTDLKGGWGYYKDATYTSGSPLVVNNARVQLTIDKLGAETETGFEPDDGTLFSSNRIQAYEEGDACQIRVDFKVKSPNNNTYFDIELDIGDGSPIIITQKTLKMVKGINIEERFSETISIFQLSTFVANGGRIYLNTTSSGDTINVYDIGMKVERTYRS